jgi:hypothetical protein
MKNLTVMLLTFLALPLAVYADEGKAVSPLSCGIYDQSARPFVERDLETQSTDPLRYTMAITTKKGKRLTVAVQNVSIRLVGERNHVSVFLDGKPYAKTSHQDLPLYLEVTIDDVKYRIICIRTDLPPEQNASKGPGKERILHSPAR